MVDATKANEDHMINAVMVCLRDIRHNATIRTANVTTKRKRKPYCPEGNVTKKENQLRTAYATPVRIYISNLFIDPSPFIGRERGYPPSH
jgi:hypothetical protein